jgi:glucan-binding YG repeat protein
MFDMNEESFEYDWTENENGNWVLHDFGEVSATVFQNAFEIWQIIVNDDERGRLVANENFDNSEQAIKRANAILSGSPCKYARDTASVVTGWVKQAAVANGKPTYGRKYGGHSVSVKCAVSGKWYYVTYKGPTRGQIQGWFDSAEKAMQVFDSRHQ